MKIYMQNVFIDAKIFLMKRLNENNKQRRYKA